MMLVSELIGCEVVTEDGDSLEHVWDVRAERVGKQLRLVGLLVGKYAYAERLGLSHWLGQPGEAKSTRPKGEGIAWSAVVGLEPGRVVVKKGTALEEL